MALTTQQGITLSIDKLDNQKCQFVRFTSEEKMLGPLPTAEIVVRCDKDLINVLDEVVVKIDDAHGNSIEAKMYVYAIQYKKNAYTIKLMSQNPKFTREVHMNSFTNIKNAIESLYPGDQVTNTDTDLLNDIPIYQMRETDYKLTTRLLHGWKKNTIFGYALDGLRITDLSNYEFNPDYKDYFGTDQNFTLLNELELTSPKLYDQDTEFVDYSSDSETEVDENHVYVAYDKQYIPVNKEYQDLIANIAYNSRFDTTKLTYAVTTRDLTPIAICEGVKLARNEETVEELFVSARNIMIDMNRTQVDYSLRSINP